MTIKKTEDIFDLYRTREFTKAKPNWSANTYFYIIHAGAHVYSYETGLLGHMEDHLKEYPDHTIKWLEPKSEWQ